MKLWDRMLETLVEIYPAAAGCIDAEGAYRDESGKKQIYNQCTGLYFAVLYTCEDERNPYYHDPRTLELAIRCWEFYYTLTRENGMTQIITYDQYWHDQYEEWDTLHWLTTLELLEKDLPPERIARWRERCYASCEGLAKKIRADYESGAITEGLKKHAVANHFLWEVVCAYRYGLHTGDEALCAFCGEVMEACAAGQHPAGTWLEGGSLVVGYCHVSYGALALFCALSERRYPKCVEAARRCTHYLLNCYYEGCRYTATFDTRQRYKELPGQTGGSAYIPSALLDDPEQRYYASLAVEGMKEAPEIGTVHQLLGYYLQNFLTMPRDAELLLKPDADYQEADFSIPDMRARMRRCGDWVVPMCCHSQQVEDSRWILERMNLFSVYRLGVGEIVGGGNSTSTPHLASIEVIERGRSCYLPEEGELTQDGMTYRCNGARCEIRFTLTEEEVLVNYRIDGLSELGKAYVHIPLFAANSDSIELGGAGYPIEEGRYFSCSLAAGERAVHRGVTLTADRPLVFTYPENGFNPYLQKQAPTKKEGYAVLTCELDYARNDLCLRIRMD